jgi:hypothetical protein
LRGNGPSSSDFPDQPAIVEIAAHGQTSSGGAKTSVSPRYFLRPRLQKKLRAAIYQVPRKIGFYERIASSMVEQETLNRNRAIFNAVQKFA